MMDEDYDESMNETQMQFSTASTTIDPSVVQSRIRQSASLRNEDSAMLDDSQQPVFPKLSAAQAAGNKVEYRRVRCPTHRYTPLREHWEQILTPLVEYLKLQVRNQQLVVVDFFYRSSRIAQEDLSRRYGMIIVLFLELQTLREASMNQRMKWDD